jgi:hypothetical protein
MSELVFTEGPDGRVHASLPTDDGPKSLALDAHGPAADFLREVGYVVHVVVTRADGGSITDDERPIVEAALEAEVRGDDARAAAAQVHFAQARVRIAARVPPARKTG